MVLAEMTPLLLELWREQHPQGHEQVMLAFNTREPATQAVHWHSTIVETRFPEHDEAPKLSGDAILSFKSQNAESLAATANAAGPDINVVMVTITIDGHVQTSQFDAEAYVVSLLP
jgi:hypothetical protein